MQAKQEHLFMQAEQEHLKIWHRAHERWVFAKGITIDTRIGLHPWEATVDQLLVISLEVLVNSQSNDGKIIFVPTNQEHPIACEIICYDTMIQKIREMLSKAPHTLLIETIAERIILLLLEDCRISKATVTVEKPMAVEGCNTVGVTLTECREKYIELNSLENQKKDA